MGIDKHIDTTYETRLIPKDIKLNTAEMLISFLYLKKLNKNINENVTIELKGVICKLAIYVMYAEKVVYGINKNILLILILLFINLAYE